jgi:hypothetical protein
MSMPLSMSMSLSPSSPTSMSMSVFKCMSMSMSRSRSRSKSMRTCSYHLVRQGSCVVQNIPCPDPATSQQGFPRPKCRGHRRRWIGAAQSHPFGPLRGGRPGGDDCSATALTHADAGSATAVGDAGSATAVGDAGSATAVGVAGLATVVGVACSATARAATPEMRRQHRGHCPRRHRPCPWTSSGAGSSSIVVVVVVVVV